jgi:Tfp pilus assembly protein PilN
MPDNQTELVSRIVVGVSIVVLGALFVWVCSTVKTTETRITVLESQFAQVVKDTDEIKRAQAKQTVLSQETAVAIQELKTMMRKRYGSD